VPQYVGRNICPQSRTLHSLAKPSLDGLDGPTCPLNYIVRHGCFFGFGEGLEERFVDGDGLRAALMALRKSASEYEGRRSIIELARISYRLSKIA